MPLVLSYNDSVIFTESLLHNNCLQILLPNKKLGVVKKTQMKK